VLERYLNAKGKLTQELSSEIAARRQGAQRAYFCTWLNGRFEVIAG
jgi:hypothetical protein